MKHSLKEILVDKDTTLKEAMTLIGNASLRTLLVANNENKLVGVITDGDIRRALIKEKPIDTPVSKFMNINPISSLIGTSKQELLRIMTQNEILTIPLLNKLGEIEDIESIINITQVRKVENTVLIMAGGFGKRLGKLTKDKPKPLLQVEDVPLLEKIIQNLVAHGLYKIIISTHYKSKMIRDYFEDGSRVGAEIQYLYEKKPLGTGGALKLLNEEELNNLPLLIMNADLVTNIDYKSFLDFHLISKSLMTIGMSQYEHSIPYGVVHIEDDNLIKISEKPKETYFINAGIYIIDPSILLDLDSLKSKFNITDLVNHLIKLKKEIKVFPIHEYWKDVGYIKDFEAVKNDFSNKKL